MGGHEGTVGRDEFIHLVLGGGNVEMPCCAWSALLSLPLVTCGG